MPAPPLPRPKPTDPPVAVSEPSPTMEPPSSFTPAPPLPPVVSTEPPAATSDEPAGMVTVAPLATTRADWASLPDVMLQPVIEFAPSNATFPFTTTGASGASTW